MNRYHLLGVAIGLAMLLAFFSGCTDGRFNAEQFREGIVQTARAVSVVEEHTDRLIENRDELAALLLQLPEGEKRDKVLAAYERVVEKIVENRKYLSDANEALANYERVTADSTAPHEFISGAATSAAPFVPPPWNMILLGAGGLVGAVGSFLGGKKKTEAQARKVVNAIEAAKTAGGGTVNFGAPETERLLRSSMGHEGRELVRKLRDSG